MKTTIFQDTKRGAQQREHWNVAGRGLRTTDRSRVSGEAAQTPPKEVLWR